MDLRQVKDTLNNAGFSEESLKVIGEVLDGGAIERGYVTKDEKAKLLAVIDVEVEAANIEADVMEEVAAALDSFAGEIDRAVEKTGREVEAADEVLFSDIKETADQVTASQ